jgi:hypothetical protein
MQIVKLFRLSRCALLCAGPAITTPSVGAQTPKTLTLGPRIAELREAFSVVQAVRELKDGRVIVADAKDRLVWIGDFATGAATQFSRQGAGPGEYNSASGLFAGPGDSTMLLDMGNRRIVMIDAVGKPAGQRALPTTATIGGRVMGVRAPEFADARAALYATAVPAPTPGAPLGTELVVRLTATGADSITSIVTPPSKPRTQFRADGTTWTTAGPNPLAARDGWAVAPDGRIAIVSAADYHVDWIGRGERVSGRPVGIPRLPLRDTDKADVLSPANQKQASTTVGGATTMSAMPTPQFDDWPEVLPAFRARSPIVSPDGRLWVERFRSAGDSVPVLDVFDATGNAVARLTLPRKTRLIGFGAEALYLVRTDDDDLQHLERYRIPPP